MAHACLIEYAPILAACSRSLPSSTAAGDDNHRLCSVCFAAAASRRWSEAEESVRNVTVSHPGANPPRTIESAIRTAERPPRAGQAAVRLGEALRATVRAKGGMPRITVPHMRVAKERRHGPGAMPRANRSTGSETGSRRASELGCGRMDFGGSGGSDWRRPPCRSTAPPSPGERRTPSLLEAAA